MKGEGRRDKEGQEGGEGARKGEGARVRVNEREERERAKPMVEARARKRAIEQLPPVSSSYAMVPEAAASYKWTMRLFGMVT
eukprot:6199526-Pleurochrysis_carterae.AAC.3